MAKAEPGMVSKAIASRNKGDRSRDFPTGALGGQKKKKNTDFHRHFLDELKSTSCKINGINIIVHYGMVRNTRIIYTLLPLLTWLNKRVTTATCFSSLKKTHGIFVGLRICQRRWAIGGSTLAWILIPIRRPDKNRIE